VLDAPASNIDGFHWRATWVSSSQPNSPIWNKVSLSPQEKPKMQEVLLSKTNSILRGSQRAWFSCFYLNGFLWRYTWACSTPVNRPTWMKMSLSPPWNSHLQDVLIWNTHSILRKKQSAKCCSFKYRWFSLESYMCFFIQQNRPIWNK
jgi:hypothetical protein